MHAAADFAQERDELEAVLASGIFNRAPNLAHVLTYVCERYFDGSAEQIKEYSIAVEALGRPAAFDQKRDSIVRVEAHRLRKRLREYYQAEGAGHAVRIEIPSGQYAPKFLRQRTALARYSESQPDNAVARISGTEAVVPVLEPVTSPAPELLPARRVPRRYAMAAALAAVAACSGLALAWRPARARFHAVPVIVGVGSPATEVRILAGMENGTYIDRFGHVWQSDRYFSGGSPFESLGRPIIGARDSRLYQTRREGAFTYDIPLPPGAYELRLYFAETLYGENNMAGGGETSRIFSVRANGAEILSQFDVIGEVSASTADIRAFKDISPAEDGKLHLKFEPVTNPAIVSGIEITAGTPHQMRPVRMVSRDHPYTDRQGRVWEPDHYSRGGQLVQRTDPIANTDDPGLLSGERYGNLRYVIPVPPGRYSATLYFAESWFGPGKFAGGGVGSRVFDILFNGVVLRRGFDIYRDAHGSDRAVTVTANGLEPDAQGKLTFSLIPVRNYACLNAIEIIDESR